jgi:hypothetical protein
VVSQDGSFHERGNETRYRKLSLNQGSVSPVVHVREPAVWRLEVSRPICGLDREGIFSVLVYHPGRIVYSSTTDPQEQATFRHFVPGALGHGWNQERDSSPTNSPRICTRNLGADAVGVHESVRCQDGFRCGGLTGYSAGDRCRTRSLLNSLRSVPVHRTLDLASLLFAMSINSGYNVSIIGNVRPVEDGILGASEVSSFLDAICYRHAELDMCRHMHILRDLPEHADWMMQMTERGCKAMLIGGDVLRLGKKITKPY